MNIDLLIKNIRRDLKLFLQTPKDYLYSYTISNIDKVKLFPYNPNSQVVAKKLMHEIDSICSHHKIHFIGSSRLGIIGQNDIDIYLSCPASDLGYNKLCLMDIFGQPRKIRYSFSQWEFSRSGFTVEITLVDSASPILADRLELFNILKNPNVLAEYERLKKSLNNTSLREYTRARMEFFNRLQKK